jgi:hypothetical protein
LNVHLAILCRNTIIPSNPPGQPPIAPNITRMDSDTRQPERCALHLSNPNTKNAAAFNAVNQMAANESGIFKRGLVLAFYFQIGVKIRRSKLAASPGFAPGLSGSKPGMLRLHHEAVNLHQVVGRHKGWPACRSLKSEGWWPAGVTLPVPRIKSPLHHFNACRPKCSPSLGSPRRSSKSEGGSACRVTLPDPALI